MKDLSNRLGKTYQEKNRSLKSMLNWIGLDDMAVYIRFNNGHALLLSTFQTLLTSNQSSRWFDVFPDDYDDTIKEGFYLGNDGVVFHPDFDIEINQHHELFRVYSIIRRCPECEFIFSGFMRKNIDEPLSTYQRTINNFEHFCADYIRAFKHLIINAEISYRHAFVFNNDTYLSLVIRGMDDTRDLLTLKERECLSMAMAGFSFKHIARELKVTDRTVRYHCGNAREKLSCESLFEAAIVALYLGEIGCVVMN